MESEKTYPIHILRRPWYEWVLWVAWLVAEVFFAENAFASGSELEPRAELLFWAILGVLLIGGGIVWYLRRERLMGKQSGRTS
jgi:hypothetical protein